MRRFAVFVIAGLWSWSSPSLGNAAPEPPALLLAEVYDRDSSLDLARYWVSEKLDGVRAYWDGARLLTRSGHVIAAPAWFIEGWPDTPMDGELWGGRGTFDRTSGIVRTGQPRDDDWRSLRFCVFDLPAEPGTFDRRLAVLSERIRHTNSAWLTAVEQVKVRDEIELTRLLRKIEAQGGEGLMLHRGDSLYVGARSDDLLKLKSFEDAEAKVIAYVEGRGKYAGMMGALLVELPNGIRFKLGTGFSDDQRRHPPPLGSWVTFAYNGLTERGIPRFARFMRTREAGF